MSHVAGVVLAAGEGSRLGRPKATIELEGVRLVDRAVLAVREAGCYPVYAVVRPETTVVGARLVVNSSPERGMRSSLELGLDAVGESDAIAVMLVDTPGIGADAIRTVVAGWRPDRIAVADYEGRRGHPTVMSPKLWRASLDVGGEDEGARAFLAANDSLVDAVSVRGDPDDIDTSEQLESWRQRQTRL